MNRFLIDTPAPGATQFTLDEGESHHAVRVMRMGPGDSLEAFDGRGLCILAHITDPNPKRVRCDILDRQQMPLEPGSSLILGIGLIKKAERLEFALEKATEIGVGAIWLFSADHSETSRIRQDRLQAHLVSAAKQSKRSYVPELRFYSSLDALLTESESRPIVLAHEKTGDSEIKSPIPQNALLLVGPEGGFSDREVALAQTFGAELCSLGSFRLRTETAAIKLLISGHLSLS
jgi:16S rRNA (uracil1498-N3)-methyltransferase